MIVDLSGQVSAPPWDAGARATARDDRPMCPPMVVPREGPVTALAGAGGTVCAGAARGGSPFGREARTS